MVTINLDVADYINSGVQSDFVYGNSTNIDLNVHQLLDNIINSPDCQFLALKQNAQILSQTQRKKISFSIEKKKLR